MNCKDYIVKFVDYLFSRSKARSGVKRIVSEDPTHNIVCYFGFLLIVHRPIRFSLGLKKSIVLMTTKPFQHIVLILYKPHFFIANILLTLHSWALTQRFLIINIYLLFTVLQI